MSPKGKNMSSVKEYNRSLILEALYDAELSRKDIAKKVNLTPASISILVSKMIEEHIIIETGFAKQVKRAGRKKTMLAINPHYLYILGINIETTIISFTLSNLHREPLINKLITISNTNPKSVINTITQTCELICAEYAITAKQLLGIGIGVVGQVNSEQGIALDAYGLWTEPVFLKKELERILQVPIVVENNVRALALAEAKLHPDTDTLTFIKYGPGIGSAFIHNNILYPGLNHKSLELGHTIVDTKGDICKCGQRGCLETVASFDSIVDACNTEKILTLSKTNSFDVIKDLYRVDAKKVVNIVDSAIHHFAVALINLLQILDTNHVIVYGRFFDEETFFKKLNDDIQTLHSNHDFQISRSNLPKDPSIGAIYLAYQKLLIDTGGITVSKYNN